MVALPTSSLVYIFSAIFVKETPATVDGFIFTPSLRQRSVYLFSLSRYIHYFIWVGLAEPYTRELILSSGSSLSQKKLSGAIFPGCGFGLSPLSFCSVVLQPSIEKSHMWNLAHTASYPTLSYWWILHSPADGVCWAGCWFPSSIILVRRTSIAQFHRWYSTTLYLTGAYYTLLLMALSAWSDDPHSLFALLCLGVSCGFCTDIAV